MRPGAACITILLMCSPCAAGDLLFGRTGVGTIDRFEIGSGEYLGIFAMGELVISPGGLDYGPDGNLYVTTSFTNLVMRFDGKTGTTAGIFIDADICPRDPGEIAFRDGLAYILSRFDGSVSRFDAGSGQLVDLFIEPGAFGATSGAGMTFGPDGDIFLTAPAEGLLIRFDKATGEPETLTASGLPSPWAIDLGPDGNFYVVLDNEDPFTLDSIRVFSPDGQDLGTFVKFLLGSTPTDLRFGPGGRLFAALPTRIDIFDIGTHEKVGSLAPDFIDDIGPLGFMPDGCYPDFTGDGALDLFDFLEFVNLFNAGDLSADCTGDAAFDLFDFLCFVNAFDAGC
jgi:streptogramin lyase